MGCKAICGGNKHDNNDSVIILNLELIILSYLLITIIIIFKSPKKAIWIINKDFRS